VSGKKSLYESILDTQEEIRRLCKEADALAAELQNLKDNFWKLASAAATEGLAKEAAENPPRSVLEGEPIPAQFGLTPTAQEEAREMPGWEPASVDENGQAGLFSFGQGGHDEDF